MASSDKNRVEYGFKNLYFASYTYDASNAENPVTIGTPIHVPGAVNFSPETDTSTDDFFADDGVYYSTITDGLESGDLEVARFTDEWKTTFGGYVKTSDGALASVKSPKRPAFCLIMEADGDAQLSRHIWYNCTCGPIKREYSTKEGSTEPKTETITISCVGDTVTGVRHATYHPDDAGYDTLFTAPAAPKLA